MTVSDVVAWHDAECGGYAADLGVWRRLADVAGGPVLDLGAGSGRVALDLAHRGHPLTAIDIDPLLIEALGSRAAARGLTIDARVGDIRHFDLGAEFSLIVIPMQTLQMLGTSEDRKAVLRSCRRHLISGGGAAAALLDGISAVAADGEPGGRGALPDVTEHDGWTYSSLPLGAEIDGSALHVRRLRQLVSPAGELTDELHVDSLELVGADELDAEAEAAGFGATDRIIVPDTDLHVGSTILVWSAA